MNNESSDAHIAIPAKEGSKGLNTVITFNFSNKLDKMMGSVDP